jgi:apolipoprotein N-acyltransferase
VPGILYLWLALYVSLAFARRDMIPISGPIYIPILAVEAAIVTFAFALDRLAAPRLSGIGSTLVFPLALVAAEFLRSRLTPGASWGSLPMARSSPRI